MYSHDELTGWLRDAKHLRWELGLVDNACHVASGVGPNTINLLDYCAPTRFHRDPLCSKVSVQGRTLCAQNCDNVFDDNIAAGGDAFGFWINLPRHPGGFLSFSGATFTDTIFPRHAFLGSFQRNIAHR